MSNTIDITLENTGTSVDVEYQDNLQNEILVSLSRSLDTEVDKVAPSVTVDFGSVPQHVYWDEIEDKPNIHPVATSGDYDDLTDLPSINGVTLQGNHTALQLGLQPTLTIDEFPTDGSTNPVQSGGVFTALSDLIPNNAMFGGVVTPNDEPPYGKDPRYFYLAKQAGRYVNFDNWVVQDTAAMFILDINGNTKRWLYIPLWVDDQYLSLLFSYKADIVDNATDGNLAGLNSEGFLTDSGYAPSDFAILDGNGKVQSSQLPSYVDDVLEYANLASFPVTGESGKIYVALDTNKTYRWSGSAYVEIAQGLALGETSSTAFAGDRGKAIEDKIPSNASPSNKLATAAEAVPAGGTTGQVLAKHSDNDNDVEWIDQQEGGGTGDYEELENLPSINNVTLIGNKTAAQLGLQTTLTIDATPTDDSTNPVQSGGVFDSLTAKQDNLVSGTNIKTLNGENILGSGNVEINEEITFEDIDLICT